MSDVPTTTFLPDSILQADNLPTIPGVAVEVLRLCRDEDATLDDLAAVLSHDAALAARLLKFSNSSLYNLGQEVSTLQRAALVLGLKTVQLMSLSFSLASSLPRENDANDFDYHRFWWRSMVRSVAARSLASLGGVSLVDEAFLCGLLSEVGQIVLAQCMEEEYATVLERSIGSWPTAALEREVLGFDHVDVGVALLRSWQIPALVCDGLATMHGVEAPENVSAETRSLERILAVANEATELLTEEKSSDALDFIEERMAADFGRDPEETRAYLLSLEEGVRETSEMLSVSLPEGKSHEEIIAAAREQFVDTSFKTAREFETLKATAVTEHRLGILSDPELNDPLTGIPNDVAFQRFLAYEVKARLEGSLQRPLGILALEIDRFESVAANFGAGVQEEVLRLVGSTLASVIRKSDLVTRKGHGSFVVIMSECSAFGIKTLAERLRGEIEKCKIQAEDEDVSVTISVGGACLGSVAARSDGHALLEVARRYLARARNAGPNQCLVRGKPLHPGQRSA